MSFVSAYPTNIVKFSALPTHKISRDLASGIDRVVERMLETLDVGRGIEATVWSSIDSALGLDIARQIEIPVADLGTALELAALLVQTIVSDAGRPLDTSSILRVLPDLGKATESYSLCRVTTLSPEELERASEEFPATFKKLVDLVESLRRVSRGDYVLAKDVNQLIDALHILDRFNQYVAYWFKKHGYQLPQDAYDLVYEISGRVQEIPYVRVGELIEPEPWNSITEVLGLEYELLKIFMEYLPRIPIVTDTGRSVEASRLLAYIRKVENYVSWWLYERYGYSYLYRDSGDFLSGSLLYAVDTEYYVGIPIVFEKYGEIAVSDGGVRTLGIEEGGSHGYVFMKSLYVYDGPTGDLLYRVVLESEEYLALAIEGAIQWCIYAPRRKWHAVAAGKDIGYIYYVDNYNQVLRALYVETGEEIWRVSIHYSEDYTNQAAVDDVDGDGVPEVVIFTYRIYEEYPNKLMIVNAWDGTVEANWQHSEFQTYWAGFGLGDVDGDGKAEYFVGDWEGRVTAIDDDGSVIWHVTDVYPRVVDSVFKRGDASWGMSLGDIDGDGMVEVIFTTWDDSHIVCLSSVDGSVKWRYSAGGGCADKFFPPFLLDVDGDGKLEAFTWLDYYEKPEVAGLYLVDHDGTLIWFLNIRNSAWYCYAVGDVDGDKKAEAVLVVGYKLYVFKG